MSALSGVIPSRFRRNSGEFSIGGGARRARLDRQRSKIVGPERWGLEKITGREARL